MALYALTGADGFAVSLHEVDGQADLPDPPEGMVYIPMVDRPPARPGKGFRLHATSERWVDVRTPEDLAAEKWAEVKEERDALDSAPIEVQGMVFDADERSCSRLNAAAVAALAAGQGYTVDWVLANNTTRTLTGDQVLAVVRALDARRQALWSAAQSKRNQWVPPRS